MRLMMNALRMVHVEDLMTNADKIKEMSAWDMARFIYDVSNGATKISVCEEECTMCECSEGWCISQIGEWLIQEAEK